MPVDLTIFAAKYLVFIAALLAMTIVLFHLRAKPRTAIMQYCIAAALLLCCSYALGQLGSALYNDPRPFTTSHIAPLIPHAADNGFPSDHALLAAALVALVAIVDPWWALPVSLLAVLVAWARVGAGIHHGADVVGSAVLVLFATVLALLFAPLIARGVALSLPETWKKTRSTP